LIRIISRRAIHGHVRPSIEKRMTGGSESAAHVVLVSQNHGIDSYGKQLGPESNGEYTHPQLSPKQKAAFAMSALFV
jgi:hypothetical protein